MDVRSTGITGRASAVRINYRKWVGPSIDTTDPSHSEFQVMYVLSDSVPCLFSKATVGKISAALGSSMTLLLHANFS